MAGRSPGSASSVGRRGEQRDRGDCVGPLHIDAAAAHQPSRRPARDSSSMVPSARASARTSRQAALGEPTLLLRSGQGVGLDARQDARRHGFVERGTDVHHGVAQRAEAVVGAGVAERHLVVVGDRPVGVALVHLTHTDHPERSHLGGADGAHAGRADDADPVRQQVQDLLVEHRHVLHERAVDQGDGGRPVPARGRHEIAHAGGREHDQLGVDPAGVGRGERRAEEGEARHERFRQPGARPWARGVVAELVALEARYQDPHDLDRIAVGAVAVHEHAIESRLSQPADARLDVAEDRTRSTGRRRGAPGAGRPAVARYVGPSACRPAAASRRCRRAPRRRRCTDPARLR